MTQTSEITREPRYTKQWLALQLLYVFITAGILSLVAAGISSIAQERVDFGLLEEGHYELVRQSASYCFGIVIVTLASVMLIEISFRRSVNILQYILIGCALCIFYLLLVAMTEHMPFIAAYSIVTLMTVALVTIFMRAITHKRLATVRTAVVLLAEYAVMLALLYLGSMALLIGSLLLFAFIAVAMYFTIKVRMENEEIVLK